MVTYTCEKCNKEFQHKGHYITHINRKYMCNTKNIKIKKKQIDENIHQKNAILPIIIAKNPSLGQIDITCEYCKKCFSRSDNYKRHISKRCKIFNNMQQITINKLEKEIKQEFSQLKEIKQEISQLKEIKQEISQLKEIQELKDNNKSITVINTEGFMNQQLINMIVDKTNTITELKNNMNNQDNQDNRVIFEEHNIVNNSLKLNNIIIETRNSDNYINATQLCKAGNKNFNDWYHLDTTKNIINILENEIDNTRQIIINNTKLNQDIWIDPILAIQLAQWISVIFSLYISKWIISIFSGKTLLVENDIKCKDQRIKILEKTYVKKHARKNILRKNVIYVLTTEYNKKNNIYVIGKTTNLKNRLSAYNKSAEHELVYYKECKSEEHMHICEQLVLFRLSQYKEQANRERVILPSGKNISFFIDIINSCVEF